MDINSQWVKNEVTFEANDLHVNPIYFSIILNENIEEFSRQLKMTHTSNLKAQQQLSIFTATDA